jgi:phosphatidate cytidylyltransferase
MHVDGCGLAFEISRMRRHEHDGDRALISRTRLWLGSLLTAVVAGLILVDLHVLGRPACTIGVVFLLGLLGLLELRFLLAAYVPHWNGWLLILSGLVVMSAPVLHSWFPATHVLPLLLLLALVVPFAGLCFDRRLASAGEKDLIALGAPLLAFALVAVPMASLTAILLLPGGLLLAAVLVLGSKLNDIGGYLVGSSFGRTKLAPGISPGKTRLGSIGGLILGVLGVLALGLLCPPLAAVSPSPVQWATFGLVLGMATQLGDLTESLLKRGLGVKDSGTLLPAFGGILDLIDSLIFSAPLGYVWFRMLMTPT